MAALTVPQGNTVTVIFDVHHIPSADGVVTTLFVGEKREDKWFYYGYFTKPTWRDYDDERAVKRVLDANGNIVEMKRETYNKSRTNNVMSLFKLLKTSIDMGLDISYWINAYKLEFESDPHDGTPSGTSFTIDMDREVFMRWLHTLQGSEIVRNARLEVRTALASNDPNVVSLAIQKVEDASLALASQIAHMNPRHAAVVLLNMNPRDAAVVLRNMNAEDAAVVLRTMKTREAALILSNMKRPDAEGAARAMLKLNGVQLRL